MALYVCKCGYPIWAESRWNGLEYVPGYSDNWENSPTFGQVITSCPQCGEDLDRFHQWWIARANTTDGYLELWESGIIRIRESCPDYQRPHSHGWSAAYGDFSPCWPPEEQDAEG